jgi:hypothetical protein
VHHRIGTQTLTIAALFALVTFLVVFPVMRLTAAFGAYNPNLFSIFLEFVFASGLLKILFAEKNRTKQKYRTKIILLKSDIFYTPHYGILPSVFCFQLSASKIPNL